MAAHSSLVTCEECGVPKLPSEIRVIRKLCYCAACIEKLGLSVLDEIDDSDNDPLDTGEFEEFNG